MAGTNFPAMVLTGAQDKILLGQSLGGVDGNVVLPPVNKVLADTSFGVSGATLRCSRRLFI